MELEEEKGVETGDDEAILGTQKEVRRWHWISTDVAECADVDDEAAAKGKAEESEVTGPSQAVIGNEVLKERGTKERL